MSYFKVIIIPAIFFIVFLSYATAAEKSEVWKTHYDVDESEFWKIHDENIGGNEGWKLIKEKKGIKTYLRKVKVCPIKSCKGVMQVESDLSTINTFFADSDYFSEWVGLCTFSTQAKVVKAPFDAYLYIVISLPWPVKSRDGVIHHKLVQDPETLTTTLKFIGSPGFCPTIKKHIRPTLFYCNLKTKPLGNGKVEIQFELIANPGGFVPDWAINFGLRFVPYITLKTLRDRLPEIHEKYKGVSYECIKEPSADFHSPIMSIK